MKVFDLRCNYLECPSGVNSPVFSWRTDSPQTAWELSVRCGDARFKSAEDSDRQSFVRCPVPLPELTPGEWTVTVGGSGFASASSCFVTGPDFDSPLFLMGNDGPAHTVFYRELTYGGGEAVIAVASRGNHLLYINGTRVGSNALQPNRSRLEKVVLSNTYRVTDTLHRGVNRIVLLCDAGWGRKLSLPPAAAVRIGLNGDILPDSGWTCSTSPTSCTGSWAWGDFGGEVLSDIPFDGTGVPAVLSRLDVEIRPDLGLPTSFCGRVTPVFNGNTADFGENITGFLRADFPVHGVYNAEISDKKTEHCSFNQKYTFDYKGRTLESRFNWFSGRYITFDVPPARLEGLKISNFPLAGGFSCDDSLLNDIFAMDVKTLSACTVGGVTMDCPHRERLGYGETGCSTIDMGLLLWESGAFYSQYLRAWADSFNSRFPHVAPEFWGGGGTAWSNFPLEGTLKFYQKYRDRDLAGAMMPSLTGWLKFLSELIKDGLLERYESEEWDFLGDWATPDGNDWGASEEALFFNCCCAARAFMLGSTLSGLLNDSALYRLCRDAHAVLAGGINKKYLKDIYLSENARYQAAALLSGIVPADKTADIYAAVAAITEKKGYLDGGSAGTRFLLEALGRTQRGRNAAVACLKSRKYPSYGWFAENGETTLPEMWSVSDEYGGSRIHTCYSGASVYLLNHFAGLSADGDVLCAAPDLYNIKGRLSASVDAQRGRFSIDISKTDDSAEILITLPPGTSGTAHIPEAEPLIAGKNHFTVRL